MQPSVPFSLCLDLGVIALSTYRTLLAQHIRFNPEEMILHVSMDKPVMRSLVSLVEFPEDDYMQPTVLSGMCLGIGLHADSSNRSLFAELFRFNPVEDASHSVPSSHMATV